MIIIVVLPSPSYSTPSSHLLDKGTRPKVPKYYEHGLFVCNRVYIRWHQFEEFLLLFDQSLEIFAFDKSIRNHQFKPKKKTRKYEEVH